MRTDAIGVIRNADPPANAADRSGEGAAFSDELTSVLTQHTTSPSGAPRIPSVTSPLLLQQLAAAEAVRRDREARRRASDILAALAALQKSILHSDSDASGRGGRGPGARRTRTSRRVRRLVVPRTLPLGGLGDRGYKPGNPATAVLADKWMVQ